MSHRRGNMTPSRNVNRPHVKREDLLSALGGSRTPNLLIRSQTLYPLGYERNTHSLGASR